LNHDLESAEQAFCRAIAFCRQIDLRYHLCTSQYNLASLLLETGRLAAAEQANEEALKIAREMGVEDILFKGMILKARIMSSRDKNQSLQILKPLLSETDRDDSRAEILWNLFQIEGGEEIRQQALEVCRRLYQADPKEEYLYLLTKLSEASF